MSGRSGLTHRPTSQPFGEKGRPTEPTCRKPCVVCNTYVYVFRSSPVSTDNHVWKELFEINTAYNQSLLLVHFKATRWPVSRRIMRLSFVSSIVIKRSNTLPCRYLQQILSRTTKKLSTSPNTRCFLQETKARCSAACFWT